jgi:hypothetical protein
MIQTLKSEEYEQIREGLIALICIGDKIKVIVNTLSRRYNNIAIYTVAGFYNDEKLMMKDELDYKCGLPIKALEVHKGELYSWEINGKHYPYRSAKRINKMIEIIESKDTRNIN